MIRRKSVILALERLFLAMGVLLFGFFVVAWIDRSVSSRRALTSFDEARSIPAGIDSAPAAIPHDGHQLALDPAEDQKRTDLTLWSPNRVQAWRASLEVVKNSPLAVLRIDRLNIRVPVFEGTDELVLNRGAGWILGTAKPGEAGNIGIAGHRDGFFRALKDAAVGDEFELTLPTRRETYVVDQIEIVSPSDVSVLRPRQQPSITLVTCYPFYFIGDAPQRFIVHAAIRQQTETGKLSGGSALARAN
jgi:sortase A